MSVFFRGWVFALALLACWHMIPTAEATSYASPPDLRSNLLLMDGKLVFIQGTGSLTVLDATSGDVVTRKKSASIAGYSGKLFATDHGILLSEYSRTTLLSWPGLEPIWSVPDAGDIRFNQDMFLSHDGNETVSGYRIADGKRLWSLKVPGGWDLVVRNEDAIIQATSINGDAQKLVWVELVTGKEVMHHEFKKNECVNAVYLDENSVAVATHDQRQPWQFRSGKPFCFQLQTFDRQGNRLSVRDSCDDGAVFFTEYPHFNQLFLIEGRVYDPEGLVRLPHSDEPEIWQMKTNGAGASRLHLFDSRRQQLLTLSIFGMPEQNGSVVPVLQLQTVDQTWHKTRSGDRGFGLMANPERCVLHEDKLILAYHRGPIECLNLDTGAPLWIYSYPIDRSYGWSYQTERARTYQDELAGLPQVQGTRALTVAQGVVQESTAQWMQDQPYGGRIVVDPEPDLLYESVRRKFTVVVAAILLAVIVAVWNVRRLRKVSLHLLEEKVLPEEVVSQTRDDVSGMLSSYFLLAITGLVVFVGLSQFTSIALNAIALTSLLTMPFSGVIASFLSRPGKQTSKGQDFSGSLS